MFRFTIRNVLRLTVVAVCLVTPSSGYELSGKIPKHDVKQIEAVVAKLSTQPMLKLKVIKPVKVEVWVGVISEPLGSSVTVYTLEKRDGKWIKTRESGFDT